MTPFAATYWGWAASEALIFARDRRAVAGTRADGGSRRVIVFAIIASMVAAVFAAPRLRQLSFPVPHGATMAIGVTLMWAGIAFRLWSVWTLGRFFRTQVTMLDDHRLIDRGPYRHIRNPAYLGALVTCLGFGVALANWGSLAIILIGPGLAFRHRIVIEEQALAGRFGIAWTDYRARSWALLPLVW